MTIDIDMTLIGVNQEGDVLLADLRPEGDGGYRIVEARWQACPEIPDGADWAPRGVGRRLKAGLRSLVNRAHLAVEVRRVHPLKVYPHGDSDRRIAVRVGSLDDGTTMTGRRAVLDADIILHRSVGGRVEWRWRPEHDGGPVGRLEVASSSSSDEITEVALETLIAFDHISCLRLRDRIVADLAARWVEEE